MLDLRTTIVKTGHLRLELVAKEATWKLGKMIPWRCLKDASQPHRTGGTTEASGKSPHHT
jgi:hypothetical protein